MRIVREIKKKIYIYIKIMSAYEEIDKTYQSSSSNINEDVKELSTFYQSDIYDFDKEKRFRHFIYFFF